MVSNTDIFIEWVNKQQPPRPGLVPQSGDWQHPYRWVRPKKEISSNKRKTFVFNNSDRSGIQAYLNAPDVNDILRNPDRLEDSDFYSPREIQVLKRQIAYLDNLFQRIPPLEEDLILYRGIRGDVFPMLKQYIGKKFVDRGFISTSRNKKTARDFADKTSMVLEIIVPRGSKGIDIDKYGKDLGYNDQEIILNRNTVFQIRKSKIDSHLILEVINE